MKIGLWIATSLMLVALLLGGCASQQVIPNAQSPESTEQPTDIDDNMQDNQQNNDAQNQPEPPEEPKFSVPEPWQPTGRLPWKLTDSEKAKVIDIVLNTPEVSEWLQNQQQYRISKIEWYALWDGGMGRYSEEKVEDLKVGAPGGPPNEADFYPGLTIIGDERNLQIAIDLTSETAVYILGPFPPLGPPAQNPPTSE